MALAEISGDEIVVTTAYQDRHIMTQIAGATYDRSQAGTWRVPLSWQACIAMRGLFGDRLSLGPSLTQWAWDTRRSHIEPAMSMRDVLMPQVMNPMIDEIEANSTYKLYPYQRVDAEFIAITGSALIANEPGLGKTGATIRALQLMKKMGMNPFPAVVVCPNSLKFTVWLNEMNRWAPEVHVSVVDGSAAVRRKQLTEPADVYVINWQSVRLHSRLAPYGAIQLSEAEKKPKELNTMGVRTIIMDEAHKLKDPRAKQTRACWAVAHDAAYRIALTGTPVAQNVGDLWALLHAVHRAGFPRRSKFIDRYALSSFNAFGGHEITGINPGARDELFNLIDPVMRRVPKQAALPQLPPKLPIQYRYTEMTPKQRVAYEEMRKEMVAQLNELLVAPNALSQLTRLAQFAASSAEIIPVTKRVKTVVPVLADGTPATTAPAGWQYRAADDPTYLRDENGVTVTTIIEDEVTVGKVQLTAPSSKVDDMVELLEEMGTKPLVVAAVSRQLIELAAARLTELKIPHGLITGAQSSVERSNVVDAFQRGSLRVVLLTLGAGAEGITLTRADTMLFMQRSWSEVQNTQAEDRIHRIGAEGHSAITIIDQVTPGTVEEHKIEVLSEKRMRMEEVVRDKAALLKLLGGPVVAPAPKRRAKATTSED